MIRKIKIFLLSVISILLLIIPCLITFILVGIYEIKIKIKMMHLFRKEKFDYNLYDLQLKVEAQQKQINELRELVLTLSKEINSLTIEVNYLSNEKYGKSI